MNTIRFNITLPVDIGEKLQAETNKSAFIAQSIREKFARLEKEKVRRALQAAYQASAEEDRNLAQELDGVSGDGI